MKYIWKLVGLIVKAAVLAAGVVVAFEAADRVRERERTRYLVNEESND